MAKRKNVTKDGPKLKVCLFGNVKTQHMQETEDVAFDDESDDQQSEILFPNLVNETQEMPPVLHFYSDLCAYPDTYNSTLSSLLKGYFIKGISVLSAITTYKYCKFHIIQLFIQAEVLIA